MTRRPNDQDTTEADPFDIAEGLNVLAHDFGLYAVKDALDELGFRARVMRDTLEGIDEAGREVYRDHEADALASDPYLVPQWARELLDALKDTTEEAGSK